MVSIENGSSTLHKAQAGLADLSVANGEPGPGAIVAVGKVKSVSLPAPDLSKIKAVDTHTRALGIIQPPPDLRAIIDKSAGFVAKNGLSFESKILEQQQGNPRFNFLRSSDPYHAYYRWKVTEEQKQEKGGPQTAAEQAQQAAAIAASAQQPVIATSTVAPAKPLEAPEPDKYTVRTPEGLTAEHLDIIKLTAQCVARNGQSFFTGVVAREQGNPTFLFLKPTNSLFGYFKDLCDAYSRTLMPPKEVIAKLKKDAADRTGLLERCLKRLEWEKHKEAEDKATADKAEAERLAMQSIDWHDFMVVETIDFFDDEDAELPPPMTQRDVVLLNRAGAYEEADANADDKKEGDADMEMDDEEKAILAEANAATAAPAAAQQSGVRVEDEDEEPMRIVKGYQRTATRPVGGGTAGMVVSPITGELVPLSEMAEHMRISLIDPQWRTQREAMLSKIRETTQAGDDEITRNLVDLAGHRPDVFGSTQEEVGAIVKATMDDKKISGSDRGLAWDGQTRSGQALHNQMTAIEDSRKRKEPDASAVPQPILGPKPPTPAPLPPPPTIKPPTGASLPVPPSVRPPPGVSAPPPIRLPVPPPPVVQRPPPIGAPPPMQAPPPIAAPQLPPPIRPPTLAAPPPLASGPPVRPPPAMPPPPTAAPPSTPAPPPVPAEDSQPDTKRQRVEFVLQDEAEFLQEHPGASKVRILTPDEADYGSLNGQVLEVEVASLSTTIADLKGRLADVLSLPRNKQQLSREHFKTMRDNQTLAYYNVLPSVELSLSVRRRGGR